MEQSLMTPKNDNYAMGLLPWALRRQRKFEADIVYNLVNAPDEWGWSWQEIIGVYAELGEVFQSYDEVNKRINVPKPAINLKDEDNIFILRFWGDVNRINAQLQVLEAEIARRKQLVGVFG